MNTRILKVDSRNRHFHVFGQTMDFLPESNFGAGVPNIIEKPGEVSCTAISSVKVCDSQTKGDYDVDMLWTVTPHNQFGAAPQDTLGAVVKNGLYNDTTDVRDKIWQGYFQTDTGSLDKFDNTRSAMTLANSSAVIATNWYRNWNYLKPGEVMPFGDTIVSEHCYVFLDWKLVNGVTMAVIDAHQGYTTLMPREVFNMELAKWGCGGYMPSTQAVLDERTKTIMESLVDALKNLILMLKFQLSLKKN
jgi:hypothetical protein